MFKYLIFVLFLPFAGFGQTSSGMVWTELGVKGSVTKKIDWAADVTTRFGNLGVNTFFPQVSVKYKLTKWFRPSLEYRAIFNHLSNGNYNFSNRLNINGEFKKGVSDFDFGLRLRYQFSQEERTIQNLIKQFVLNHRLLTTLKKACFHQQQVLNFSTILLTGNMEDSLQKSERL